MYARVFYMFHHRRHKGLLAVGEGVHLAFNGVRKEPVYQHGVLGADLYRFPGVFHKHLLVIYHFHAAAAQELVASRPAGAARFDTLVARAVAPLSKLLGWFEPRADAFGRLLVIKGPRWEEELAEARAKRLGKKVSIRRIASWPLVDTDNESVLLEIRAAG